MDTTGQIDYGPYHYGAGIIFDTLQYYNATSAPGCGLQIGYAGGGTNSGQAHTGASAGPSSLGGDFEMLKLDLWQHLQRSTLWGLSQKFSAELAAVAAATSASSGSLSKTFSSSLSELLAGSAGAVPGAASLMSGTAPAYRSESVPIESAESASSDRTGPRPESASFLSSHGVLPPGSFIPPAAGRFPPRDMESIGAAAASAPRNSGGTANSSTTWPSLMTGSATKCTPTGRDKAPRSSIASTSAAASTGTGSTAAPSAIAGAALPMSLTCYNCGLGTTTRKNLARHIRSCLGYRPHHCPLCPYAASRRDNLRRHLAIHKDMPLLETSTAAAAATAGLTGSSQRGGSGTNAEATKSNSPTRITNNRLRSTANVASTSASAIETAAVLPATSCGNNSSSSNTSISTGDANVTQRTNNDQLMSEAAPRFWM